VVPRWLCGRCTLTRSTPALTRWVMQREDTRDAAVHTRLCVIDCCFTQWPRVNRHSEALSYYVSRSRRKGVREPETLLVRGREAAVSRLDVREP